jgi:dihydroorotate dehydrogenase (NAD+) catalytic subunit
MGLIDMSTELSGLRLDNPVIPASGCFGFGYEFAEWYDINILGSIALKGTTREARFGNETPRIAEAYCGMLNSVGLQNPGIEALINTELVRLKRVYSKKVIANLGGFSAEDYAYNAALADKAEEIGIIEVNISCPNVHKGGVNFGSSPDTAYEITKAVRAVCKKPVYIKLSPNVTDITEIARACEAAGADGLSLINTLLGMRIDLKKKKPVLKNRMGGLSGPAVFPVALRMVWQVYEAVKLPLIGIGGITAAEDVIEMMLAGASAVQVGAANLKNPYACKEIIENLPSAMEKYGIASLKDIIGRAHD